MGTSLAWLLLGLLAPLPLLAESDVRPLPYAPGDARLCLQRQPSLVRFEVLPGSGWDNLRNVEAANVVSFNFSDCLTTDDGRFLVPDSVATVPVKASQVQAYAELFTHWSNYTSSTATSVNVDAGASFKGFSISGKFSSDYSSVKSRMIGDRSMTTRVQIRYVRYTARLQPDQPLAPKFRQRLLRIATHLQVNQTEHARYDAQLLVRDFGTHVITSADAGAIITQTDQVKSSYIETMAEEKTRILAAASASFFSFFHLGISTQHSTDTKTVEEYRRSRTWSTVESEGGPAVAVNLSLTDWSKAVDKDMVAIDRHGDPLWYLLTPQALPELPESILYELTSTVREAVDLYYAYNTYRGCTRQDAPNFSPVSNLDDGTCQAVASNLTLGGVFLTCSQSSSGAGDLCGKYRQLNPKTGAFSCPEGYSQVELHSASLQSSRVQKECHGWWIFKHCHDATYFSHATVRSYWCAAQHAVPMESGFLFGGLYTPRVANPITQDSSCPELFHPMKLGTTLVVCLSDDYELATKFAVPFGGFFSCTAGNPLAVHSPPPPSQLRASPKFHSMHSYLLEAGPGSWPHHCSKGYSQHLAVVEGGCSLHYCVQSGALSPTGLPPVRRPPYFRPALAPGSGDDELLVDTANAVWKRGDAARLYLANHDGPSNSQNSAAGGLSAGGAAAISVVTTLACVAIVTAVVLLRRRRASRRLRGDSSPVRPRSEGYGAISEEVAVTVQ